MSDAIQPEFSDEAVGQRLKLLRKRLAGNVSQTAMGELVGITQQSWQHYETGKRHLDTDIAHRLCNDFHVTLDWIYRGSSMMLPVGVAQKLATEPAKAVPRKRAAASA